MEENRLDRFEKMLTAVHEEYEAILSGMEKMKTEGKVKTVTYQQMLSRKMMYQNILSLYQIYGLTEEKEVYVTEEIKDRFNLMKEYSSMPVHQIVLSE